MKADMSDLTDPRPGDQGTVFPSLGGADPGENDPGQNLGDFPFGAPLHQDDEMPLAEGVASEPAAPVFEGQPAPPPPEQRRRGSAEERINRLTARYRQTETQRDVLAEQVAQLSQVITQMQQSAPNLQAQRSVGSNGAPLDANPLAGMESGQPGGVDANTIRRIVEEAVAPLAQTVSGMVQTGNRNQAHTASFARAVEDYPDLGKPGSEARRHFDNLYRTHPLSTLEDGPEQLAVLVRGVLASSRRDSQSLGARKIAAGALVPTPSAGDDVPDGRPQLAQATDALRIAAGKYRKGDNTPETFRAMRLAMRARSQLRGQ